jgi:hypothetical protein
VGSKTFDGVWFVAYSHDHLPPHVHGEYAGTEVLIELKENGVAVADRSDAIRPRNAKRSNVMKILNTASDYESELKALWRIARAAS